jgi:hypothetical protein
MTRDLLLALGLLMSAASQLRPTGAKIGPSEACLVLWLLLMLGREAGRLGPPLTPVLGRLIKFWLLFASAQCIGTLTGYLIGDSHDPDLFLHDVLAYPLLAAVSLLSVVEPGAWCRLQRVAWHLVWLGAAFLALQLSHAFGLVAVASIDPWYWDRLRGWSENPNQLALFCTVLGLLSLHLAGSAARFWSRAIAIGCAVLSAVVGRLTKSDTFSLVLVAAGPIFVGIKLREWLISPKELTLASACASTLTLALPLLLAATVPLTYSISVQAEGLAKGSPKGTEREALLRFHSWKEAINRGLESGMLGLGPGPHIEIPPEIVAARQTTKDDPKNVEHPSLNSAPNFEAHNTLLDLFTQGGLLAVLSFIWLVATSLSTTYRAKLAALTTLICGLALFSIFHLIVRHPLFWFATDFCLVAGHQIGRTDAVRTRS